MRTDAEELDFARECERIEKNGGDVQGYIGCRGIISGENTFS